MPHRPPRTRTLGRPDKALYGTLIWYGPYYLFGATPIIIGELKGQVIEACLTELMDQLIQTPASIWQAAPPYPTHPSSQSP